MQGLGALIRTEKNIRLFSMERVNKVEVIESNWLDSMDEFEVTYPDGAQV